MHAIFFGAKRVHIEAVWRLTRPLLDETDCELTPARFDLMRIVHLRTYGVPQRTLQWLLGVSAPTVSRMLKALERLGMITRPRDPRDARCRQVHITTKGKACVEMALAATVGKREDQRAAARCATGDTKQRERVSDDQTTAIIDAAKEKVAELEGALARMRKALFDVAPAQHPWRETDCPLAHHTFVDGVFRYGDENPYDPAWRANPVWTMPSW